MVSPSRFKKEAGSMVGCCVDEEQGTKKRSHGWNPIGTYEPSTNRVRLWGITGTRSKFLSLFSNGRSGLIGGFRCHRCWYGCPRLGIIVLLRDKHDLSPRGRRACATLCEVS